MSIMWTPSELKSELRPLSGVIWRAVEDQHAASTMKLVDSDEEQVILEEMIDADAKPPIPPEAAHLDYLLMSPFRYQPVKPYGSRFRAPGAGPGVFYASESVATALAEIGYYRLRFFLASPDTSLAANSMLTVFSAAFETEYGLDFTRPGLVTDRATWTSKDDYINTRTLAESARQAGARAIGYESVRDPGRGVNMAILVPEAFKNPAPLSMQSWRMLLTVREAVFHRLAAPGKEKHVFPTRLLGLPEPEKPDSRKK